MSSCEHARGCGDVARDADHDVPEWLKTEPRDVKPGEVGGVELQVPTWLEHAIAQSAAVTLDSSDAQCSARRHVNPLSALAAPGRAIVRCCDDPANKFDPGCSDFQPCAYLIAKQDSWVRAASPEELAHALGPVTSALDAIGRVALSEDDLRLPARTSQLKISHDPRALTIKASAFAVTELESGFDLELATRSDCGCKRPIMLTTFHVSRAGLVTRGAGREIVPDNSGVCAY
jgi:hypothetical protein